MTPDEERAACAAFDKLLAECFRRQTSIPGTEPDVGGLLKQKAAAPIKPTKPQKPCDIGLFGDEKDQTEFKL